MDISLEAIAQSIDHTLLRPEATPDQIDRLCDEALRFGFAGACVNPVFVRRAAERLDRGGTSGQSDTPPVVVSVAGFPLGAERTDIKVDQARRALDDGADEIDMVIALGALIAGDITNARKEIEAVAHAVHGGGMNRKLKVILETAVLDESQIIAGCRCCAEGEADFVKTSTGFHPAGGATVGAVRLLHRMASPLGVKASGGIRTAHEVRAMLAAGATRVGTSSGVAIMEALTAGDG